MTSLICICPGSLSLAVTNKTKSNLGTQGFISTYRLHSISEGSQSRKLEAGAGAENLEEHYLLACLLMLPRTISPGVAGTRSQLILHIHH